MFEPFLAPLGGGILIGLASGGLYLLAGEIAGITGIARSALLGPVRRWQLAFLAGMLLSGLLARMIGGEDATAGLDAFSPLLLVVAGLLVGIGTDLGNGCTSGHGVCGLSRLSRRSLVAVCIFMVTAGLTTFAMRHGGLL